MICLDFVISIQNLISVFESPLHAKLLAGLHRLTSLAFDAEYKHQYCFLNILIHYGSAPQYLAACYVPVSTASR